MVATLSSVRSTAHIMVAKFGRDCRRVFHVHAGPNRARRIMQHFGRHRPEQQRAEEPVTVGRHHDQVRAVLARIVVDGLGGVAFHDYAMDLEALEPVGKIRLRSSRFPPAKWRVVSITGTAPPYQSGMRPEGISSTCSSVTSALYFFAMASTKGAVAVQLSDMSTGKRIFWNARMGTAFQMANMHAVCHVLPRRIAAASRVSVEFHWRSVLYERCHSGTKARDATPRPRRLPWRASTSREIPQAGLGDLPLSRPRIYPGSFIT